MTDKRKIAEAEANLEAEKLNGETEFVRAQSEWSRKT